MGGSVIEVARSRAAFVAAGYAVVLGPDIPRCTRALLAASLRILTRRCGRHYLSLDLVDMDAHRFPPC
jgi:hypothetical protein